MLQNELRSFGLIVKYWICIQILVIGVNVLCITVKQGREGQEGNGAERGNFSVSRRVAKDKEL